MLITIGRRAALLAVIGVLLSMALVVTEPSTAKAFTLPPAAPPTIAGATAAARVAGPGAVACAMSGICLAAVGTAAVAVGLYATRDTWVPVVSRFFGSDMETSTPAPTGPSSFVLMEPQISADGRTMTYGWLDTRASGLALTAWWGHSVACGVAGLTPTWTNFSSIYVSGPVAGETGTKSVSCPAGTQMMAFVTGPGGAGPTYRRPANELRWASAGYPEEDQRMRVTARCVTAGGTTQDLVVEYSAPPAGQGPGFVVPSCSAAGIGTHADQVTAEVGLAGRTDFQEAWKVTAQPDPLAPECDPALPSSASCLLSVWVDGTACQVGDARCLEWMSHSASRLMCTWGSAVVPLSRCDMLERAYRPGGVMLSEPAVDGNPGTAPSGQPGTGGEPGTSTPTNPGEVTDPEGQGETTPTEQGCAPSGWQILNPAAYVRATVCIIKWAFVPAVNPLAVWGAELGAAMPALPSIDVQGDGAPCGVPLAVPEQLGGGFSFNLLPVCPGEAAHGAAGVVRGVVTAVVTLAYGGAVFGAVCWAFGWSNPLGNLLRSGREARA